MMSCRFVHIVSFLDSRLRGNDKEERGNDKREEVGIIRGNRTARKKLEKRLGRSVISNENYLKNPEKKKRLGK